jgi:GDP-L-fucose synthase
MDDLVRVIDYFIGNEGKFKCYNVTPDEAMELRAIAEKVREISGKDLPILIAQDGMGLEYSGDNQRLRREIPGLSFTPIDQAIHQLYDWYASNRHLLNREFLLVDK